MHSPSLMLPHEIPRLNLELSPSLLTGHCSGGPQRGGKEHGRQPTGQVCVGMGGGTILKELLQAPQRPCSSQPRPHPPPPPPPLPLPLPAPAPSSRFYEPQGGGIFLDGRPAGSFSLGEWPSVGVEGGGIKHVLPYGGC